MRRGEERRGEERRGEERKREKDDALGKFLDHCYSKYHRFLKSDQIKFIYIAQNHNHMPQRAQQTVT